MEHKELDELREILSLICKEDSFKIRSEKVEYNKGRIAINFHLGAYKFDNYGKLSVWYDEERKLYFYSYRKEFKLDHWLMINNDPDGCRTINELNIELLKLPVLVPYHREQKLKELLK